jgi:hypothetical protein
MRNYILNDLFQCLYYPFLIAGVFGDITLTQSPGSLAVSEGERVIMNKSPARVFSMT